VNIKLPYDVFDKRGVAKYSKEQKSLTVTLPVRPLPVQHVALSGAAPVEEGQAGHPPTSDAPLSPLKEEPGRSQAKKDRAAVAHSRWVAAGGGAPGGSDAAAGSESSLSQEIAAKAKEAVDAYKASATVAATAPLPQTKPESAPLSGQEEFISSSKFAGEKSGYAFKNGPNGVGYYRDRGSAKAPPATTAAATKIATQAEFHPFVYEYRQTKDAIAVLVQVPNILCDSVSVKFFDRGFDVLFSAEESAPSGSERIVKHYALGFTTSYEIVEEKCKFDVASLNMVVALFKRSPEFWLDDVDPNSSSLTQFEDSIQKILPQPITILRPRECDSTLIQTSTQRKVSGVKILSSELEKAVSNSAQSDALNLPSDSQKASPHVKISSSESKSGVDNAVLQQASKLKFTVGALLDLD
jgi:hypothetical protein